jgi:hypothetical protein
VPVASEALQVRLYRPPVHSATIVLNGGFVQESIDDPRLVNFASALAESGFLVLTPDYPAVRALEFTPTTIDQIVGLIRYLRQSSDWCGPRPLALIGLSYVGTLSLKAALRRDLTGPPEFLGVFGGYADFAELMRAVFQDVYRSDGIDVPVDPYGRFLVLRSVVDLFNPPSAERIVSAKWRWRSGDGGRRRRSTQTSPYCHPRDAPAWMRCGRSIQIARPSNGLGSSASSGTRSRTCRCGNPLSVCAVGSSFCTACMTTFCRVPAASSCTDSFPRRGWCSPPLTHVNPRLSPATLWSHGRELGALSRVFGELMALQG